MKEVHVLVTMDTALLHCGGEHQPANHQQNHMVPITGGNLLVIHHAH